MVKPGARRFLATPVVAAVVLLALPGMVPDLVAPVHAQVPGALGVEVRAGAGIGAFEASNAGLQIAPRTAWGLSVSWGPTPALGGYLAYSAVGFGCTDGFCRDQDVSFTSRGLSAGVRAEAPLRAAPWVRGGLLFHDLDQRWSGAAGPRAEKAEGGLGFEAAGGLSWPITERLSAAPGLHVGFLPTTRAVDGATENAVFFTFDVGLRFSL
jgi:hypothetical protein